jgi:LacI family transcriptional regulator
MAVSLRDIAKRAKVSFPAVSSVVNNSKSTVVVSDETRQRIKRIAKELGYRPNSGARAIRQGRFNRIAWVPTRMNDLGWSSTQSYLNHAVGTLAHHGYSLVFEPLDLDYSSKDFIEPPRLFSELAVDGILAFDGTGLVPEKVDTLLVERNSPLVWVNRNPVPGISGVVCDEKPGAKLLVDHLVELGHRRIGYIGPDNFHYSAIDRFQGVVEGIEKAGLDPRWARQGKRNLPFREIAEDLLNQTPRLSALICYGHVTFDAAMEAVSSKGLRVPQDLSLCYFASPWELDINFSHTAVILPEPQMGKSAVELLMEIIGHPQTLPTIKSFTGKLRKGSTSGPPGKGE